MANDWIETTLGDISIDVSYGYTESANTEKVGPKFLRITDIQNGVVDWKSVPYCPIDNSKLDKYVLEKGDIVVARTGNSTGENYIFTGSEETVYASYLIRFRIDENIANPFYVWYSMRSPNWWAFVNSSKTGSAQAGANAKVLGLYPLDLPNLDTQKAIAYILGSLDDKIELNRQMNETLEAMAQALFKSWFVDFDPVIDNALAAGNDIPDEFIERAEQRKGIEKKGNLGIQSLFPNEFELNEEMGWIPKGWEVSKLGEYIEVKRGGSPRPIHDYLVPKGLPWVKISDATASNSRFLVETKQFIKPEGLNKTTLLKKGSLILSNSATPGLPKFLDLDACIHDGWLHFPKKKIFTDNYLYQLFLVVRQELLMQGNGSVFTNLKTDILKNHMVVVPNIDVLNYFDNWINSFHNKIHAVQIDVDNLSRIRDTLLPKLMSGELRIPDDIF